MRVSSLKAAANGLPARARKYPMGRGAGRVAETLELFSPDEPHPSSLLAARPAYKTTWGAMYEGDAAALLAALPDQSLDLVVTSPPYALHFKKEYGNVDKEGYVEWFRPFGREIYRALKPKGSFVLNIGGSYNAGAPTGPSTTSACSCCCATPWASTWRRSASGTTRPSSRALPSG